MKNLRLGLDMPRALSIFFLESQNLVCDNKAIVGSFHGFGLAAKVAT